MVPLPISPVFSSPESNKPELLRQHFICLPLALVCHVVDTSQQPQSTHPLFEQDFSRAHWTDSRGKSSISPCFKVSLRGVIVSTLPSHIFIMRVLDREGWLTWRDIKQRNGMTLDSFDRPSSAVIVSKAWESGAVIHR